jgi:hypothetical protein
MRTALDELANAVQGALGLAALIRRESRSMNDDAIALEAAVNRAAAALRRLQSRRGAEQ